MRARSDNALERGASGRRARLSYANVTATLALILALGGTAWAASRYVITSTGQIAPGVRAAIKGATGPSGATGPTGLGGGAGPASSTAQLVDGQTLSKIFLEAPTGAMTPTTIFSGDGLTLQGYCDSGGSPVLTATSTDPHAELNATGSLNNAFYTDQNDGFTSVTLLAPAATNRGNMILSYANNAGQSVKAMIGFDDRNSFYDYDGCAIWGTAAASG